MEVNELKVGFDPCGLNQPYLDNIIKVKWLKSGH